MSRALGRRDLLKLGAGAVIAATAAEKVSSQGEGRGGAQRPAPPPGSPRPPGELRPHTGTGYKNDYNRLGGNGPMDDTTRKIVKFVREFSDANLTTAATAAINRTMVDSMGALITGFEGEVRWDDRVPLHGATVQRGRYYVFLQARIQGRASYDGMDLTWTDEAGTTTYAY